jgi:hypothetical protein
VWFFDRAIYFTCVGYEEEEIKTQGKPKGSIISRLFK